MVCVVFGHITTELDSLDKTLKQIHYFQAYLILTLYICCTIHK